MRLLVESDPRQLRIALLEGDRLAELHLEGEAPSLVGDVYLGRVRRLVPAIDAAFVDIGQGRNAFLHADDFAVDDDSAPLSVHQPVIVQVFRDEVPGKGARARRGVSLPGRLLVLLAPGSGVAVSSRIEEEGERQRLVAAVEGAALDEVGWIVRTAARGAEPAELELEAGELLQRWRAIERRAASARPPVRLHRDLGSLQRWLRDRATEQIREIWVDSQQLEAEVLATVQQIAPLLAERIHRHQGALTLFDRFGVSRQVEDLRRRRVPLPSGGSLVIESTEALVAIDVNSGRDVGASSLEATALATDLEAAIEVARQIRLRDLAGIIVVDFIDLEDDEGWTQVRAALEGELAKDRAASIVEGPVAFGLFAITRKRGRNDLLRQLSLECPECRGTGFVRSPLEVVTAARRALLARESTDAGRRWRLRIHPDAAAELDAVDGAMRRGLEASLAGGLEVEVTGAVGREGFEILEDGE